MARLESGVSIEISGIANLRRKMGILAKAARRGLKVSASAGAEPIRQRAEENAPRDQGFLQDNIMEKTTRNVPGAAESRVAPRSQAFYGMFAELGTKFQPAKPWLRPAFDSKVNEATVKVGKAFAKFIRRAVK